MIDGGCPFLCCLNKWSSTNKKNNCKSVVRHACTLFTSLGESPCFIIVKVSVSSLPLSRRVGVSQDSTSSIERVKVPVVYKTTNKSTFEILANTSIIFGNNSWYNWYNLALIKKKKHQCRVLTLQQFQIEVLEVFFISCLIQTHIHPGTGSWCLQSLYRPVWSPVGWRRCRSGRPGQWWRPLASVADLGCIGWSCFNQEPWSLEIPSQIR